MLGSLFGANERMYKLLVYKHDLMLYKRHSYEKLKKEANQDV